MTVYAYSRIPAFNPNTSPVSVAKSATGSVYDLGDTGFLTPLNLTLVATNTVTTTLVSDANGMFPDFTLLDRTSVVFKSGSQTFVLTTSTPIPGPAGPTSTVPGPPGPPTTDASLLTAGTLDDARLPSRLSAGQLNATYASKANNLSDLASSATARTNLGLGDAATHPASDFIAASQRAAASGVASLDSGTKVPTAQIPDLSGVYIPKWQPATVYTAGYAVLNPSGDVVTAKTGFTSGASYSASNWNLSASYPNVVSGTTGATGVYMVADASGTYQPTPIFGNAGSMGFAGTGSPVGIAGAFGWYVKYGASSPGSPVLKTTQGAYGNTLYYGPTTDDSAEGGSSTTYLKDDANAGWSQTKPVISWEANVRVEGAIQATTGDTAPVGGMGSRLNVLGTAHVASGYGYKTSTQTDAGATGTIDKYVAYWQQVASGAATAYGMYVIDPANSETQLSVGRSAGTAFKVKYGGDTDSSTSLAQLGQPTVNYGTLSGAYTLTTTPQNLTTNAGATLPAGGGTFMLDSSARTIVTYTSFSGTTVSGATIASGSVGASSGQLMLDPATSNTTALRINAQKAQAKNITEWYDSGNNLRLRVNAQGNLVTQGTSFFAANGSATTLAAMNGSNGSITPGTPSGLGSGLWSGNGAPNVTSSVAGDYYFRKDTPSTSMQRIYVATAANTWTAIA